MSLSKLQERDRGRDMGELGEKVSVAAAQVWAILFIF